MRWWYLLVVALDLYLFATLGSWIVLQIAQWLLHGPGQRVIAQREHLRKLLNEEAAQRTFWPQQPRPGRYRGPDLQALEALATLRAAIAQADRLWPSVAVYVSFRLSVLEVLRFGALGPMGRALASLRDATRLDHRLRQGESVLAVLQAQQVRVQEIPRQAQARLNEARAEAGHLGARLETEVEAGTTGLDGLQQRLQALEAKLDGALDALLQTSEADLPKRVEAIDAQLSAISTELAEMDRLVSAAFSLRAEAQDALVRMESNLGLTEERWKGLKARGATEPDIARDLAQLRAAMGELTAQVRQRTPEAYQQVVNAAQSLDGQVQGVVAQIETLDELMRRSKEAIEGDVRVLAEVQALCDDLVRQDSLLEPDQSLALIEKAGHAYMEAERQRGLGTMQGYEAALAHSQTARQWLAQAQDAASSLPEVAGRVRALLGALSVEVLGESRSRADRVREQLALYAKHWTGGLAGVSAEAISCLEQAEVDLERLSPNVRYLRRFRQSELEDALAILTHAQGSMRRAQELIDSLENEQQRLGSLRTDLSQAASQLNKQIMPALGELAERMLPELRERSTVISEELARRAPSLDDPAQTDYEEATGQWLPRIFGQLAELRADHEDSVRQYQARLRECGTQLERQWARLARLRPHEQPGPEEDVERLATDLAAWRAEAERQVDNPLALREITARRASALEQRIESVRRQVSEGRGTLDTLARQYNRHAQAGRSLRNRLRDLSQTNPWPRLEWDTAEAERAWEQAIELERASRAEATLAKAADKLQRAVNAAQSAEQLYARVAHQMENALRRLVGELRAVDTTLERVARRAQVLREQGQAEEAAVMEEGCANARRAIESARAATSFEDALGHLREAQGFVGRG